MEKLGEQPVDMLEINISCPNVKEGGIAFGQVPASACLLYTSNILIMLRAIILMDIMIFLIIQENT